MRWVEHAARMEKRSLLKTLIGKCEGKRPLERRRYRWKYNDKANLE
jgi:hypothetical protein